MNKKPSDRSQKPTIRSIAAEAGVSPMTLSMALRNRPEIKDETRRRLQRLARLRGYRPDPTIAKLMQHLRMSAPRRNQANICGIAQASGVGGMDPDVFAARVQVGVKRRAESLGFSYARIEIPSDLSSSPLQRILGTRGVEGLILLPMPGQRDLSRLLDWNSFSVVSVTASVVAPHFHSVTPHHFDNVVRACARLARLGYRRIGLAISQDWDERVRHRWTGAVAWQNSYGGTEPVAPFLGAGIGPRVNDPSFGAWLDAQRPDALLVEAIDDDVLAHALKSVPRQRRPVVVTLDWPAPHAAFGIDQNPEIIGSLAIELLAGMISRGERGLPRHPMHVGVDGTWVSRKNLYRKTARSLPDA